jgi:GAF domain-containing protein
VCGTSYANKETIIVEDVNQFPGHIFCDSNSKSEIVIPLFKNNEVAGVIDVDSAEYSSFDETDRIYLEELSVKISTILS